MPCTKTLDIDTSKPVLVTGATGYVAGVLIQQLLEKGVTIHATVRDPSQKDRLEYLQSAAAKSNGSIKFFKGDLLEPGSFAEAMKGCSVVFHTASPFTYTVVDPTKDLIEPAVHGTENVLVTCSQTPSVKRVILTSSMVAMFTDAAETSAEKPLNEGTWNRTATLDHNPYALSKTLAEQKAWTIAGGQTQWTLCTINPGLILGPGMKYHESSESYKILKSFGSNDPTMSTGVPDVPLPVVDVRDVAAAHIAAAYLPDASGRILVNAHSTSMPEVAQSIGAKYYPEYPIAMKKLPFFLKYLIWLIAPFIGQDRLTVRANIGYTAYFDNSKSVKDLGMEFLPLAETTQEMYQQLIDVGAVSKSL